MDIVLGAGVNKRRVVEWPCNERALFLEYGAFQSWNRLSIDGFIGLERQLCTHHVKKTTK